MKNSKRIHNSNQGKHFFKIGNTGMSLFKILGLQMTILYWMMFSLMIQPLSIHSRQFMCWRRKHLNSLSNHLRLIKWLRTVLLKKFHRKLSITIGKFNFWFADGHQLKINLADQRTRDYLTDLKKQYQKGVIMTHCHHPSQKKETSFHHSHLKKLDTMKVGSLKTTRNGKGRMLNIKVLAKRSSNSQRTWSISFWVLQIIETQIYLQE